MALAKNQTAIAAELATEEAPFEKGPKGPFLVGSCRLTLNEVSTLALLRFRLAVEGVRCWPNWLS